MLMCAAVMGPLSAGWVGPAAADPPELMGPWELMRSDHGIVAHRSKVAGSSLYAFRGVGLIEAPIAEVLAVLDDAEHRKEWMTESVANVRVQKFDSYNEIFYSRTGAPWPLAHRDVVCRASTTIDPAARQVRVELTSTVHPAYPPIKGVVRMPFLRGHWYLWPEHGGAWTRAEYQIHLDLGGRLPEWIMNRVSRQIPHDTLMGMRQQSKRRHYPDFIKHAEGVPAYRAVIGPAAPSSGSLGVADTSGGSRN